MTNKNKLSILNRIEKLKKNIAKNIYVSVSLIITAGGFAICFHHMCISIIQKN